MAILMKRTVYQPELAAWGANTGIWMRGTILLVDSDLGFVFWLGQVLDLAGYSAIPAKNTTTAKELVTHHKLPVDILIIDPSLPDVIPFISTLRDLRHVKVVGCLDAECRNWASTSDFDFIKTKPKIFSDSVGSQWIEIIESLSLLL